MARPATTKPKCNAPVGSLPVLQYCSPDQLQIDPSYQRSLETGASQTLIRKIAIYWDWGLCQPLFVARRADGGLYVVDGQHRLEAAKLRGDIWQLPCVVTQFDTAADEAASFVALNQQRRPLSKLDLFNASLAADDAEARAISAAVAAAGLRIGSSTNLAALRPGAIVNIGGLQRCIRSHGSSVLELALRALATSYPAEVLRYAGTIFPGIVALTVDRCSVDQIAAVVSSRPQERWYGRVLSVIASDATLGRWSGAQRTFRDAWAKGQGKTEDAAAPKRQPEKPPLSFEEQVARVESGKAHVVPAFHPRPGGPDRTLGGVAPEAI